MPAGSKATPPGSAKAQPRHSYTPSAASFRAAFSGKDTLPVLKRTSSSTASSRYTLYAQDPTLLISQTAWVTCDGG